MARKEIEKQKKEAERAIQEAEAKKELELEAAKAA